MSLAETPEWDGVGRKCSRLTVARQSSQYFLAIRYGLLGLSSGFHVDGHQAVIFLSLDESRVKQKRDESYQTQALQRRPIMI